jgi:two-component system response regulator HydG
MTTHPHDPEPYAAHLLTGESVSVRKLRLQIARIAPHFRLALVTGEPGVGHQTVARHLHLASPVAHRAFTVIPSSDFLGKQPDALPDGTVYLHGVEALLPAAQAKLLRALKRLDRETRLVVGSPANLKGMVATGRLRNDLYEAIAMLEIAIAPLRDRREDLEFLASAMLARHPASPAIRLDALQRMRAHAWPGNLEELWRVCQPLALLSRAVEAADLAWPDAAPTALIETVRLEDVMHRHVMDVLQGCSGNKLRAAELLGISRSTLYRMLETAA